MVIPEQKGCDDVLNLTQVYFTALHPDRFAVKTRTLHKWMTDGTLVHEIISLFENRWGSDTLPEWCGWFLDNHHWILDGNLEASRSVMQEQCQNTIQAGWWYSGVTDTSLTGSQIREICKSESWPASKMDCLEFCGMVLCHGVPVSSARI